jgi:prolyl 4-hydroxylase
MGEVDYKAAIGAWLGGRLRRNPLAMKIPSEDLDIYIVRDFLDEDICTRLIALIDADSIPSTLLSPNGDPEFRTSDSCNLHPAHPTVKETESRFDALMGIDPAQGETIQGQRYAVGQRFKGHHDFFYPQAEYWPDMERTGGQRTWTAMVFLNEPGGGGETFFPSAGVKVTPRRGNLLAWNNLDADGVPNPFSLHEGLPVSAGAKYIITKWYRERDWIAIEPPAY